MCFAALGLANCSSESEKPIPIPHPPPATATQEGSESSEIFGSIFFEGEAPRPRTWSRSSDPVCRRENQSLASSEEVVINSNATLRNVFVYISSSFGARRFPVPKDSVVLNQQGCRYLPHVFGVQTAQPLVLLNSDSTFHNVYAAAKVNRPFNLGMTLAVKKIVRAFERPEVMVPFRCNVHPWMASYAGVLDHPFYDVTGAEGTFRLGKLPAGEYEVTAWHERFGVLKKSVTLRAAESKELSFKFESK